MGVISIVNGDYKPTYNYGGTTLWWFWATSRILGDDAIQSSHWVPYRHAEKTRMAPFGIGVQSELSLVVAVLVQIAYIKVIYLHANGYTTSMSIGVKYNYS